MKVAWLRLLRGGAYTLGGFAAAYYGKDWIVGNKEAVSLIATIFSVLAGFLVAVMALVADERFINKRNASIAHFESKALKARLIRHKLLFQLYLIVMLLAFAVTLKLGLPPRVSAGLEQVMLGLSVFAFLVSFSLPSQIMSEYMRKISNPPGQP